MTTLQNFYKSIISFFQTTKLGHHIKSAIVTFTGIFFGMLILTPAYNNVFGASLPTIQAFKDLGPVILDTFYRAIWSFLMIQLGLYKYSSNKDEKAKPILVPNK